MNAKELREMDDNKLTETLVEKRKELFDLRFRHTTAQLDNTQELPQVKRDIARILTVQRERATEAK